MTGSQEDEIQKIKISPRNKDHNFWYPKSLTTDILGDIQAGYLNFQDICPTLALTLESKRSGEEQV